MNEKEKEAASRGQHPASPSSGATRSSGAKGDNNMRTYMVSIPSICITDVTVEAESEDEARREVLEELSCYVANGDAYHEYESSHKWKIVEENKDNA